jgi:hypothetical protein
VRREPAGCGLKVTSSDGVQLSPWCAAWRVGNFEERSIGDHVMGLGDRGTAGASVGRANSFRGEGSASTGLARHARVIGGQIRVEDLGPSHGYPAP